MEKTFRTKLAFIAIIGLFVAGITGALTAIVVGFIILPVDVMITILLGILLFGILLVAGIYFIVEGIRERDLRDALYGILFIFILIMIGALSTPTDNYTDWENTTVQLLSQIEEGYIVDNENEYAYKVLEYSETGEEIKSYKNIEKDEDTVVEIVKINADGIANVSVFTREAKSILGTSIGTKVQNKYVFYIPE